MNNKRFALVVPNNRIFNCGPEYFKNLSRFDIDLDNVRLFVVDDHSPFITENLRNLGQQGIPFEYLTIDKQEEFFKENFGSNYEKYWSIIPHRTDACRSFGYLTAALWGADVIITFDDDNFPFDSETEIHNYIGCHDIVNSTFNGLEVRSSNGWLNTIDLLETKPETRLFARGYPYRKRSDSLHLDYRSCSGEVLMNVGLWTINPDVDSLTVLGESSLNGLPKTQTVGFKNHKQVALSNDTLAPLNTANTAYSRALLPIIYDTFQGALVGDIKLDRFGDIWCNLFINKILQVMNKRILIGPPLVEHRREPRDTFEDFKKEFWGINITEKLSAFMESVDLHSSSYVDLYLELIQELRRGFLPQIEQKSINAYLERLFSSMETWTEVIEKLRLK